MGSGYEYQRIASIMREPKPIEGARALLFERLTDLDPRSQEEPEPLRILNRVALRESVRRELGRLLNTRCSIPTHLLGQQERTVIDYGIPDFSSFSPQSSNDQKLLAAIIGQTISAFEPRLRQVEVTVEGFLSSERALLVRIDAVLVVESISEQVSFPVIINNKTGTVQVHESQ